MKLLSLLILFLVSPMITDAYTKAPIDVTVMDITDLSSALDAGIITSTQLVNIYLDRINEYDDEYNSINQINSKALDAASSLDEERKNGHVRGVLHGIPILVKTNIDVDGLATTDGAKALLDNYPNESAEVIKRLIDAGAIIIGSTNMSEFAFRANNSYSSFGSVKNAWNSLYTPYGSSGGSAVAIALSFAAAALGTDTNSSIRVPASANNLVGFRSTLGFLSTKGVIPYDTTRDVIGPITKTVKDSAILLSIMNEESKDYVKYTTNNNLSGITIGVPTNIAKGTGSYGIYAKTDSDIYNLFTNAVSKYEELGAKIVYLDNFFPSKYSDLANNSMAGKTFCVGFNEYIKNTTGTIRSFSDLSKSSKKVYDLDGYLSLCNKDLKLDSVEEKRDTVREYLNNYYEENEIDVVLYPTTKNKLIKLTELDNENLNSISKSISSTAGYPAITLPLGFINELPYGMELLALKNGEDVLVKIASSYDSTYNTITIPDKASNLYEIDDKTSYIVEQYQDIDNESLKDETKEYFNEYNEDSNNEELYNKYINNTIEKEKKEYNFITKVFIVLVVCFIVQKMLEVKPKKKKRSYQKKKQSKSVTKKKTYKGKTTKRKKT